MSRKKIMWRIYASLLVSTMTAFAAMAWYATYSLRWFHQDQVASELLMHARIVTREAAAILPETEPGTADRLCKELGRLMTTRITIVLPDGRVIGDAEENPAGMENHRNRPEITAALKGETGKVVRFSDTRRQSLMYLAIPVRQGNTLLAVVRVSLPLAVIDWSLHAVVRNIILGWLIVATLFAVVTWLFSRRISRPLEDMRRVAERIARGDLEARVARPDIEELDDLARMLNQMAAQLGERLSTITRQRNEQEAVLASMVEGVLAVDRDERILHLNHAAARLLDLVSEQARGRSIQEAVRNRDLQVFISAALAGTGPAEGEIIIYGNEERFLQLHGTALTDIAGHNIGALIVLNDITRLKRLETVRRDFVANVSHELKTPITALRGCVDTLSDPAHRNPEDDTRFMAMMSRQVDRLSVIVEDLLHLSRIEHDVEHKRVAREKGAVCGVLSRAAQTFARAAEARGVTLTVDCQDDLIAPINAPLLEQALGNLIDNAIKYGGERKHVVLSGAANGNAIEIRVTDEGSGIEKKHLTRIFERFYRVDQARSRAMGGTGLGLAIVKHIALAHQGTVSVENTSERGTTFLIRIPRG